MSDRLPNDVPNGPLPEYGDNLLLPVLFGVLGALFIAPAFYIFIIVSTGQHGLAELLVIPAMIGGGIAVGWASVSRFVVLRILVWGIAGFGAGSLLEAVVMGGLGVGTVITLSGIVLGVGGAVLGALARR